MAGSWRRILPPLLSRPGADSYGVFSKFNPWETCDGYTVMYSLNVYVGCQHRCLYCYARSYICRIHPFDSPSPRKDFLSRLERDVKRLSRYIRLPVAMSNSTDPYQPIETRHLHARGALSILGSRGFPVLVTTKSELVVRDIDVLRKMDAVVAMTVTDIDNGLVKLMEPYAPSIEARLRALRVLRTAGVKTIVRVDPLIPGWNDEESRLRRLFRELSSLGVAQVVSSVVKVRAGFERRLIEIISTSPRGAQRARVVLRNIRERFRRRARGYLLADRKLARDLLRIVADLAREFSINYSFCMEDEPFEAETCNGVHLLSSWEEIKGVLERAYEEKYRDLRDAYSLKQLTSFKRFVGRRSSDQGSGDKEYEGPGY